MTTLYLRKTMGGFLPDTEEDQEKCRRFKMGDVCKAEIVNPRNYKFLRKWFSLVKVGYELWEETCPRHKYKGEDVMPNFDRFRRDVTVLAGFFNPTVNIRGELRLDAESISFANMGEDRFEELYSETINVLLQKILYGRGITEDKLRQMADSVMGFS